MKKTILFLSIIIFSSCTKILEEVPKSFIAPENYYQNEKDAEGAIIGVYSSNFINSSYINFNALHTDYALARGSFTSLGNFSQVIASDQIGRVNGFWTDCYVTINRANVVLDRVPQIVDINENTRTRILAEACFLRAFSYFALLKDFGPVPLRTSETTGTTEKEVPRATVDQVNELMINDLLIAENDLPETVGNETGKASKWTAKMLLAAVYLNKEDWSKAAEKADEVIMSNNFSLVEVTKSDDFYNIFATITNPELIFAYHQSQTRLSDFVQWYHGAGTPYNRGNVWGFTNLPDMNSPIIQNWDINDLRLDFNLYSSYIGDNGVLVILPPSDTQWRFKKWIKDPNGYATYSVPIYRYAEAFLTYAEASCMAEGSPSNLALERLNVIRRRAYGYNPNLNSPVDFPTGMSKDEFRNKVLQERAYEFFFEGGIQWWDLRRTNLAKEVIEASGKPFTNYRLLYPIPLAEIENNPAINQTDQNPGY
ncbi:MAG TPA: RagB/SusD family nutrient uptake outer membrane protein [Bacteroidales bacterium]|nr:RagB/SusD family nutrient uptake outer membrane protein [Bacteroidales bacterium]